MKPGKFPQNWWTPSWTKMCPTHRKISLKLFYTFFIFRNECKAAFSSAAFFCAQMCESAFRRKLLTKWSHFLLYLLTYSCSILSLYISEANLDKLSHDCNTQCISVNFWRPQPFFYCCPPTTRWLLFKVHEARWATPLKTYVPKLE